MRIFLTKKIQLHKFTGLSIISTLLVIFSFAQTSTVKDQINRGIKLYDKGDYTGAVNLFKKVLQNNSKLPQANYEIASSYFKLNEFEHTIKHCNIVIAVNLQYVDQAFILKGSAQDMLNKNDDAIKTYKAGIRKFPENYLLYYNLALTSYNVKDYKNTDEEILKAIQLNPSHASSHLLLGYSMSKQDNRVKAILALSNFLMLEPTGDRASKALDLLEKEFKKEKKQEGEKNVTTNSAVQNKSDEFRTAEFMLSLLASSNMNESNKNKSAYELFTENMKTLFTLLGELKNKNKGFWWDYYVDFFYSMSKKNHVEAFSYYISQAKKDNIIYKWLEDNNEKYKEFSDWYTTYKR